MRKQLLHLFIFILAAVPVLGAFGNPAAAASSRVAVITEMKGSVKVKKAGGSKEFTAFAKMSLNEGDILSVGVGGSAVLQFANGTSEDDRMTVSEKSTLSFSKLTDKKGTTTKVSLFNGSAWVDVKSIEKKDDEFTLETPTAIMGVRGTHLLVNVNPITGGTHLTVVAGVVNTQTTDPTNPDTRNVYPTENALVTDDRQGVPEITIASVDLERLMKLNDSSIVQAIVQAAGEITKENDLKMNEYLDQYAQSQPADKERHKSNVQNLLGAIIAQALDNRLLTQDRVNQLLAEVRSQSGIEVDLTKKEIKLSEEEKQRQNEQRRLEAEAQQRALEQKAKEDSARLKELADKLDKERKQREEEKRKALEAKKKKALEEYEKLLSELEKKRFNEDKNKLGQGTTQSGSGGGGGGSQSSPTNTNSPSPSTSPTTSPTTDPNATNASLGSLSLQKDMSEIWLDIPIGFDPAVINYTIELPDDNKMIRLTATPAASGAAIASVQANGSDLAASSGIYTFYYTGNNEIVVKVVAPNGTSTKTYTVKLVRPLTMNGVLSWTNDGGIAWKKVNGNQYGGQALTSLNNLGMSFGFDPNYEVEYAEIQYVDSTEASRTITTDSSGNLLLTGLKTTAYQHFSLQLYDSSDEPIGDQQEIWLMNGIATPNFQAEDPFKLMKDVASPSPIDYDPSTEEDHFEAVSDHWLKGAFISVPYVDDMSPIVPVSVFDHQKSTTISPTAGKLKLDLQLGNNDFTVSVMDRSGLFVHTYELSIFRKPAPEPLSDWRLLSGSDSLYWNEVDGLYGKSRYYVDVPADQASAQFHMTWDPASVVSYKLYDEAMGVLAEGGGASGAFSQNLALAPGYNRYLLELKDKENYLVKYELVVVRGDIPEIKLGAVELKQLLSESTSVTLAVYSTGTTNFKGVAINGDANDFTFRMLDHSMDEVYVYAPGFTSPDGAGVYSFYDVPNGIKPIEIIVDEITHREQKTFNLDLYYNYSNADLKTLFLENFSMGTEIPFGFNPAIEEYNIELGALYFNTRVTATPQVAVGAPGTKVMVKVDEGSFVNGSSPYLFNAAAVYTELYVQVTAMDGVTTKTYKLNLRRPMPNGVTLWTSRNISNELVKWQLTATTAGDSGLYRAYTTPTALLDMSFKFTSGSPATDYVVVKQLTGVTDLSHADAGTPTGTQWVSDSMGALQITGMTTGSNYYLLEVYDNSSGTPVRIGPAHYLELVSS